MTSKTRRGSKPPKTHVSIRSATGDTVTTTNFLKEEDVTMQTIRKTYIVEFQVFAVGDIVRPTSPRCPLPMGEYRVVGFIEPIIPYELSGVVFVEGHEFGVDAEYLTVVHSASAAEADEFPTSPSSRLTAG